MTIDSKRDPFGATSFLQGDFALRDAPVAAISCSRLPRCCRLMTPLI